MSTKYVTEMVLVGGIAVFAIILSFLTFTNWPGSTTLIDPDLTPTEAVAALSALTTDEQARLLQRETKRLASEPLDRTALMNIAILKSLAGNKSDADAYAAEAATRSLRDVAAQLTQINAALSKRDYKQAFYRLDGVLTAQPQLGETLYPMMRANLEQDNALKALAAVLKRNPTWRNPFMIWLIRGNTPSVDVYRVIAEIRSQGGEIFDGELRAYMAKAFERKNFDGAYFAWLDSLDVISLTKVTGIFDGQFSEEPKDLYFDWNIVPFENADIGLTNLPDAVGRRALSLHFYGSNTAFGHVSQFLKLQPGHAVMEGTWTANHFDVPAGLAWQVTCVDESKFLGQSEAFHNDAPWTPFSFEFDVPLQGCTTQFLRLVSASTLELDLKLDGDLRFTNLKILQSATNVETANP